MAVISGLTVSVGADTSKFNKEIKSMDREIANTGKQVDALSNSLKIEWDAGRFAQAQKVAQDALLQTEQKVIALKRQMDYLDENGGSGTDNYRKLQTELINTETKATLLKQRLAEIRDLKIDALASKFEKVGSSITKVGQALTPLSALAVGLLASFGAIALGVVKTADEIGALAGQINISAESLQKWRYVAMQTDLTDQELQMGLVKVQDALGKLATGEITTTSEALMKLGFSSEQASLGMGANFEQIITALSNVADETTKTALVNELFGAKMGSKFIPLLNAGAEGLNALTAEFSALGYMTNDQVSAMGEFDNVINRIKYSFKQIGNEITVATLPLMNSLSTFIEKSVVPAIQKLSDWYSGLTLNQQKVMFGTLALVASLAPVLLIVGKLTSGIGGIIKVAGGLSKVMGVLSAHPLIAIIGVVIGLLAMLYSKNADFKASIDGLVSSLGTAFMPLLSSLGSIFGTLVTSIGPIIEILSSSLIPIVTSLIPVILGLVNAVMPLVNALAGALAPILASLLPAITSILNAIIPLVNIILAAVLPVLLDVMNFITPIIDLIVKSLVPVIQWLGKAWSDVFTAIPVIMEKVLQGVEDFINGAIGMINKLIDGLNVVGDVLGFTIGKIKEVEFSGAIQTGQAAIPSTTPAPNQTVLTPVQTAAGAIMAATPLINSGSPSLVTNNDYSDKNIVINVTVQNYADEVDVDEMVRQINLKLAEQM